ncbi:MAG: hypothetical protein R3D51_11330 [Hyphomicrobiaceae bacterium]
MADVIFAIAFTFRLPLLPRAEMSATLQCAGLGHSHTRRTSASPKKYCASDPVAATDVGNLRTLIQNNVNGFLVPAERPYEIANLLRSIVGSAADLMRLRSSARATVLDKGLDLETMQRRYRTFFDQLNGSPNLSGPDAIVETKP